MCNIEKTVRSNDFINLSGKYFHGSRRCKIVWEYPDWTENTSKLFLRMSLLTIAYLRSLIVYAWPLSVNSVCHPLFRILRADFFKIVNNSTVSTTFRSRDTSFYNILERKDRKYTNKCERLSYHVSSRG